MTIKSLEEKIAVLEEKVNMLHEMIDLQTKHIDNFNMVLKLIMMEKQQALVPVPAPVQAPPVPIVKSPSAPLCAPLQRIVY
jgi:hypothetical protein